MDINIDINEEGVVTINNKNFEMIEIEPGVRFWNIKDSRSARYG